MYYTFYAVELIARAQLYLLSMGRVQCAMDRILPNVQYAELDFQSLCLMEVSECQKLFKSCKKIYSLIRKIINM